MTSDLVQRFFGRVVNGELKLHRPVSFQQLLRALEGKEFEITIQPRRIEHSAEQRGYIHALCRWLTVNTETFGGWEEDDVYRFFMQEYASRVITKEVSGKEVLIRFTRSIKELSKKEVSELIEKILTWLANEDIHPPTAEEAKWSKYSKNVR